MWIYVKYYRMVCKDKSQLDLLDQIEKTATKKTVINKEGKEIVKHDVGFFDFNKLNLGITFGKTSDNDR
jgi:hypothetical protein